MMPKKTPSKKFPAIQFYVGDWRKDVGVQALNYHDKGVWLEMLCLMHESEQRGKLVLNGQAMSDQALARLLGLTLMELQSTLSNLLGYGVASRDLQTGVIYNRRMVRDEADRAKLRTAGKAGAEARWGEEPPQMPSNPMASPMRFDGPSTSSSSATTEQEPFVPPSSSPADTSAVDPAAQTTATHSAAVPKTAALTTKKATDPRHAPFKELVFRYYRHANKQDDLEPDPDWDGAEARQLSSLLKANPNLDADIFRRLLANRLKSAVNHSERPCKWLSTAKDYLSGPLDRFGKPMTPGEPPNGNQTRNQARTNGNLSELEKARAIRRGKEGSDRRMALQSGGETPSLGVGSHLPRLRG